MKRRTEVCAVLTALCLVVMVQTNSQAQAQGKGRTKTSASSHAPVTWGVGLRLGDPTGLSVKKYLSNGKAFEVSVGRSNYRGYDYRDAFHKHPDYRNYDYIGYNGHKAISIQGHYLIHKDFQDVSGLQWYWGFGAQVRLKSFEYTYRYDGGNAWIYVTEKVTDVDFGGDAIIGGEYRIKNAPLSVFADVNILLELADDPLTLFGQGGIGIRYNF